MRFRREVDTRVYSRDGSRLTVEARLNALGYATGSDDNSLNSSLRLFQEDYDLPEEEIKLPDIPKTLTKALDDIFELNLKAPRPDFEEEEEDDA